MASPSHLQASSEHPRTEGPKESNKFPSPLPNSGVPSDFAAIPAQNFNYPSFSELLESVVKSANSGASPVANQLLETVRFKGQFGMSHQEALASVTATATQMQFPAVVVSSSADTSLKAKSEVPFQLSSDIGQMKTPSSEIKTPSSEMKDIAKSPNSDGYGWRKYGQKQVKSSESFRSYYRCTHVGCQAKKKVQHPGKSGCITGVDYKGQHNHDPPTKVKDKCHNMRTADSGSVVSTEKPKEEDSNKCDIDTDKNMEKQSDKKPDVAQSSVLMPPPEGPGGLSDANEHIMTDVKKGTESAPVQKRRLKDRARANCENNQKSSKQPKVVVHGAGDVDLSTDGYRWRKYGQKMVKGNPYPRSYYKCSSTGCPARKHVEKSTDNSTATLVTYEGEHNHDKPVPKKRHSPATTTQCCAGENTGKAPEAKGAEKMIESARTLLSIGIELKSC